MTPPLPPSQTLREGVQLPVVEGHAMMESLEGFERRCLIQIAHLQADPYPNMDAIEIIAQAVRCVREYRTSRELSAHKAALAAQKAAPQPDNPVAQSTLDAVHRLQRLTVAEASHQPDLARVLLERDSARDQMDRHIEWAADQTQTLRDALRNLLAVIAADELIPESVSYMREARAALAACRQEQP